MPRYVAGLDIGGSRTKAVILDDSGRIVGRGYHGYPMRHRALGQAEHDAETWWIAAVNALRQALIDVPASEVDAIGVSCTNGLVAVDHHGTPLRPAIMLWDQRSRSAAHRVARVIGTEAVSEVTGNPVAPGTYSLPIIVWLQEQEPQTLDAAHAFLVPGGFIVQRLTGEFTIDYSRACTTLLFDIRALRWHDPFLHALAIPPRLLPRPLPSGTVAGTVTADAAAITGLRPGVPVIAGCMDTVAAAIGSGVVEPGHAFAIIGTAARVASVLDTAAFDLRFMHCTFLEPARWLTIGAINGAGAAVTWSRRVFAMRGEAAPSAGRAQEDSFPDVTAVPAGSRGLVFLPYLAGERTPVWDADARGAWVGLTLSHDRGDLFRSILEGAAYAIRQSVQLLEETRGSSVSDLRVSGGGARSPVWMRILVDVLGMPLVTLAEPDTEPLGAAMLAAVSVRQFPSMEAAVARVVTPVDRIVPDPVAHASYNKMFTVYTELYPTLKSLFLRMGMSDTPETEGQACDR